jgi:hypothetical protein
LLQENEVEGIEKIKKKDKSDKKAKKSVRKDLLLRSKSAFCCKKFEKCKIKIKKIRPTPKSMTQRKPTNMSASSKSKKKPKKPKNSPPRYQRVRILREQTKKRRVKVVRISKSNSSFIK